MLLLFQNLITYIEENYQDYIHSSLNSYFHQNRVELFKIDGEKKNYSLKITRLKINKFGAIIDDHDVIHADVYLTVFIDFKFSRRASATVYNYIKKIKLEADMTIEDKISFDIVSVDQYKRIKSTKSYDENLMLRIHKEEYQKYADEMLDYYGVKRNENGVLDVIKLLKKMNVKLDMG